MHKQLRDVKQTWTLADACPFLCVASYCDLSKTPEANGTHCISQSVSRLNAPLPCPAAGRKRENKVSVCALWFLLMPNMYVGVCTTICMYVCMNVCMHVCMCVQCMHVCMYVCMHACKHACMYVCMAVCMYVCACVCMYACLSIMHVCMYACLYVCNVCMCLYVCT